MTTKEDQAKAEWDAAAAASAKTEFEKKNPPRRVFEKLWMKYTPEERDSRVDRLIQIPVEIAKHEEQGKAASAHHKNKIGLLVGEREELSEALRNGGAERDVEFKEVMFYETNTIQYFRADTGEHVKEKDKAMTKEQRQVTLPLPLADAAPKQTELKAVPEPAASAVSVIDATLEGGEEITDPQSVLDAVDGEIEEDELPEEEEEDEEGE